MNALSYFLLILSFVLLFVFHSILRNATSSDLANLLIVGGVTVASTVIIAFTAGVLASVFRGYRSIRANVHYPVTPNLQWLRQHDLPSEFAPTVEQTELALSPLGYRLTGCVSVTLPETKLYQGSGTIRVPAQ